MDKETQAKMLESLIGRESVRVDEPLAAYTTFLIGGPADFLVSPRTEEQVCSVVAWCREADVPFRVMGLGSDVLVSDRGVRGVVLRLAENFAAMSFEGEVVQVQAGCSNEEVARAACLAGLSGYEFACGIPGTVGGAAIMNAGAYGGEFKDVAEAVRCLTSAGEVVDVPAAEAAWSYRHSMMDEAGSIVLGATLRLVSGECGAIQARMDDLAQRRSEKQPLEMPSAGSTFKRPEGCFVGQLVQEAGLRGYRVGGAQVSEKHTGFVVNAGGATADDVRRLVAVVQERVLAHAGVLLEPEVRMWGFED
ncbi:UDP-N-acetylmuramate dehydrogenase [Gordonibacter sp.]|uniref:UDP-N-acetylmuramate dehydrogenase n=1 Tax=Gordonibacter sp. TaxID=1968902 RepID=UPI003FA5E166